MTDHETTACLTEALARLGNLAANLCSVLPPIEVASSFAALAAGIVQQVHGRPAAANYLRQLAAELDDDGPRYDA